MILYTYFAKAIAYHSLISDTLETVCYILVYFFGICK